jgi:2-methylisocitrate lyase-like PEP mutase family enzyme
VTRTVQQKRARFRELHAHGCFILPNPWDIGSARMLEHLGFEALASISTGFAWTMGRPDYALSRSEVLQHLAALSDAFDLPVNADFEAGFASDPEGIFESVKLALATGISGLSIEDRDLASSGLYGTAESVGRVRASRAAREVLDGRFDALGSGIPGATLNEMFETYTRIAAR